VRDWLAILKRAVKETLDDHIPTMASALAYSTFFAIPSVLLVAVGLSTLVASPSTITTVIDHFDRVMPHQAAQLVGESLHRLDRQGGTTLVLTIVGFVLAVWSLTGAMTAYMTAVNIAYDRKDRRNFVKRRLTALFMAVCIGVAFLLVAAFLILGPHIERWIGDALGIQGFIGYVWWAAQWPVLIVALLASVRNHALARPGRRPPALAVHHTRLADRRRWLAGRLGGVRGLYREVRLVQQDVGLPVGGDRDADVALAHRVLAALRRGGQRRGRTQPRASLGRTHRLAGVQEA
jgi:hypothetical protein